MVYLPSYRNVLSFITLILFVFVFVCWTGMASSTMQSSLCYVELCSGMRETSRILWSRRDYATCSTPLTSTRYGDAVNKYNTTREQYYHYHHIVHSQRPLFKLLINYCLLCFSFWFCRMAWSTSTSLSCAGRSGLGRYGNNFISPFDSDDDYDSWPDHPQHHIHQMGIELIFIFCINRHPLSFSFLRTWFSWGVRVPGPYCSRFFLVISKLDREIYF